MPDITNYSFQYKALGQNKWECLVIDNGNQLRFGVICFSPEQPKNERIFAAFLNKTEFKEHFFLDCDMVVIPEVVVPEKEVLEKGVDLSPKTDTLESDLVTEKQI